MCVDIKLRVFMTAKSEANIDTWPSVKHKGRDPGDQEKTCDARLCDQCGRDRHMCQASGRARQHERGSSYYCDKDLYVQIQTSSGLMPGCFYYENITSSDAKLLLKSCAIGVFLVRTSQDPNYLYTLSVRTRLGPTSIRIVYYHGRFSLDSDAKSRKQMPQFCSLMELIDYYVRLTTSKQRDRCRFLDKTGMKDLPIVLNKPRLCSVPSLRHLSRVCINRSLLADSSADVQRATSQLPLPGRLRSYIKDYPYLY